jgi:uncharacterized protein YndB with AHSA1/START domain
MAGLTVDRSIAAAPERVWRAVTVADELVTWFWPESFATEATLEARAGGELRIHSPVVGIGVRGFLSALDPGRSFTTTWRWDSEDEETVVTLAVAADGDRTRLTVRHDGFSDGEAVADHVRGWNDCLDRLDGYLGAA